MHLRALSLLKPDHTDADEQRWVDAARTVQKVFRGHLCRKLITAPLKRKVSDRLLRVAAAEKILQSFVNFKSCRDSVARRHELQREKVLCDHAVIIQRYVRYRLAIESYGRTTLLYYHTQLAKLMQTKIITMACILLQAWTRGHLVRRKIYREQLMAKRIQKFFRLFKLYGLIRLYIFKRRVSERELRKRQEAAAETIRCWYLRWLPFARAREELRSRQSRLVSHFSDSVHAERRAGSCTHCGSSKWRAAWFNDGSDSCMQKRSATNFRALVRPVPRSAAEFKK
jgi:hypothetical protein